MYYALRFLSLLSLLGLARSEYTGKLLMDRHGQHQHHHKFRPSDHSSKHSVSRTATTAPTDPTFFQLVFGPVNGANNAPGYMGKVFLQSYDVGACAQKCNTRSYGATEGACIYFNIWTAVVNGTATEYVCSLYNMVADVSSAVNTGQGALKVTASRGYSRTDLLQNGSFQDYTCLLSAGVGCPYTESATWKRYFAVSYDYILISNFLARSGTSSARFFFNPATVPDARPADVPSTLTYTPRTKTVAGGHYVLSFFYAPNGGKDALFSVWWNGAKVLDVVAPSGSSGTTFLNAQVQLTATGNDVLVFRNGGISAHEVYVDDVSLFQKWT